MRRERLSVVAAEPIGAYTLLRLRRGGLEPGRPGQFFMLEAPGRLLPRAMSLCFAPPAELAFLIDAVGPGTRALCALDPGPAIHVPRAPSWPGRRRWPAATARATAAPSRSTASSAASASTGP